MGPAPVGALHAYDSGSRVEWIESDGVGGMAASTLVGANARKQHALLAVEFGEQGRCCLVSSVEESVTDGDQTFALSTSAYCNAIHPEGYQNLAGFTTEPWPTWRFHFDEFDIERQFFLVRGEHTAVLTYQLLRGSRPVQLRVRPMLAFRPQNIVRRAHDWTPGNWQVSHEFAECKPRPDFPAVYIAHPNAAVETVPLWYRDFLYARDLESGVDCVEDLFSPGSFGICLAPRMPRSLVISTPSPRSTSLVEHYRSGERSRRRSLKKLTESRDPFCRELLRAAELFVYESGEGHPQIYAGLPWGEADLTTGLIALPGLLLCTRRVESARDYLAAAVDCWNATHDPRDFAPANPPEPHAPLDGPLWAFIAAWHYWTATQDRAFLGDELYPALDSLAREYATRYAVQGRSGALLCALDGDYPQQGPRIRLTTAALWYNAHCALAEWAVALNNKSRREVWNDHAHRIAASIEQMFVGDGDEGLANAVSASGDWRDLSLRSSQALALGLPFCALSAPQPHLQKLIETLATPLGLRSLSPQDPAYVGDGSDIRFLPQRWSGSIDPGLFGYYCDARARVEGRIPLKKLFEPLQAALREYGFGCLPGAFAGDEPHVQCDYVASACAVGEALRIYTCESTPGASPEGGSSLKSRARSA